MKQVAMVIVSAVLAVWPLLCAGETACTEVALEASVEVGREELTLADLMAHDACKEFRQAAERLSLGAAPRAGKLRLLDGRSILPLLETLVNTGAPKQLIAIKIPERIVVQRAGATKSCAQISGFVRGASSFQNAAMPGS